MPLLAGRKDADPADRVHRFCVVAAAVGSTDRRLHAAPPWGIMSHDIRRRGNVTTMKPTATEQGSDAGGAAIGAGAIASGSGIAALLAFIVQTPMTCRCSFLVWTFTWPIWCLIVVSAALGAGIWLGLGVLRRRRRRKDRRDARSS